MDNSTQYLNSIFKSCLDILRNDAEHIVGEDALYELTHFITFKLLENIINNDISDEKFQKIYKVDIQRDEKFNEYFKLIKFNELIKYIKINQSSNSISSIFNTFRKYIFPKHPLLKIVFNHHNSIIKEDNTIRKILLKIDEIKLTEKDILGEAYERLSKDVIFGTGNKKSEFGQFFTPPKIKNLLINLVNPKIKENNEIESVLDPSSGTGGILINVIKHYKNITKDKFDKENLLHQINNNIYGIEIKGKVFNLGISNMLINTGKVLKNIKCDDSITKFQNIKVDTIIANPPFSISIKYNEINQNGFPKDYLPINVGGKNSELLFIQMMIYCLNINGRCATVMLDGAKIYSNKSNYHKVREYLMKTCELHEVISCPAGSFTSTGAKTCILYFTKKKNGIEIMTEEKKPRSKKIINGFINEHMTKTVKFYKFDNETEEKIYLCETDINNIMEKNYSLRYEDYKIEEKKELKSCEYEIKSLGEICEFKRGGQLSKENFKSGNFPVIGSGKKPVGFHNEYNRDENTILCASSGTAGLISRYITKVWASDCFSINSKDKNILNEDYLYYYLLNIQDKIYSLAKGATHKHIYPKDFDIFQIPIPSLEKQNMIVEYLDNLLNNDLNKISVLNNYYKFDLFNLLVNENYEIFTNLLNWSIENNKTLEQIELIKLKQKKYLSIMNIFENNYNSLGEICEFKKGKYNSGDMNNKGNIPFYSCKANNPSGFHDKFSFDYPEYLLLILAGGSQNNLIGENVGMGKCYYVKGKNACMSGICALIPKNNEINIKYIYYYLVFNRLIINKYAKFTTSLGSIAKSDIEKLQIPIPSLEKQNAIVEYLDHNEHIIKLLKKDIELNNNQYNLIIKNYKLENNEEEKE